MELGLASETTHHEASESFHHEHLYLLSMGKVWEELFMPSNLLGAFCKHETPSLHMPQVHLIQVFLTPTHPVQVLCCLFCSTFLSPVVL